MIHENIHIESIYLNIYNKKRPSKEGIAAFGIVMMAFSTSAIRNHLKKAHSVSDRKKRAKANSNTIAGSREIAEDQKKNNCTTKQSENRLAIQSDQ